MGKVISLVNQKGGVGKTTTAINLSTALSTSGKKVLLIDTDPQSNVSIGLGVDTKSLHFTIYDCLVNKVEASKAICPTQVENLFVLPSISNLINAEVEMLTTENKEQLMKEMIEPLKSIYDYIVIDCSPSLGLITVNSLVCSDSVIIPVQCDYFAFSGISSLLNTIKIIKNKLNPYLEIEGFLLTMYDKKVRLDNQIHSELNKHFQGLVFKSKIYRSNRLRESNAHSKPILVYDLESHSSSNYIDLADELIKKNK